MTRWWTPAVKNSIKLKKDAFQDWLTWGSPWGRSGLGVEKIQKKHFKQLLNTTITFSMDKAESEDTWGKDSSAEVTGEISQLLQQEDAVCV